MREWSVSGVNATTGRKASLSIPANNKIEAETIGRDRGLLNPKAATTNPVLNALNFKIYRPPKPRESAQFFRTLALSLEAGVSQIQALESAGETVPKGSALAAASENMIANIRGGMPFSEAAELESKWLGPQAASIIEIGSQTGQLAEPLASLADSSERRAEINGEVKSALNYPLTLLGFTLLIMIGISTFLVPQFLVILEDFEAEPPTVTKLIVSVSDLFKSYWHVIIGLMVGSVFAFSRIRKKPGPKYALASLALKTPIIGKIVAGGAFVNTCEVVGLMLNAGISEHKTFKLAAQSCPNAKYGRALEEVPQMLNDGLELPTALELVTPPLPKVAVSLASQSRTAGQNKGSPWQRYAQGLVGDLKRKAQALSKQANMVVMLVVGAAVGVLGMAVMLPMFTVFDSALQDL